MPDSTKKDIEEFRLHFDSMYIGGIPRLLDETGAFLAFLSIITAIDALAGAWNPKQPSGERFKGFIAAYFSDDLKERGDDLWYFRNSMVHSFNPGPFALVCGQSHLHMTPYGEVTVLNAQDFFATLIFAGKQYFQDLSADGELQARFRHRITAQDGGAPDTFLGIDNPRGAA